jgi:DNA modification methylase
LKKLEDYLYYEEKDPDIKIYQGDCLQILPLLGVFDLVITDPPYGIDYQSAWRTDRSQWKEKIHGDKEFPLWLWDLCKPLNAMFVWCRWDNLLQIPKPKSFIVWDKKCHSMGDLEHEFGRQWEACAFYPGPEHKFTRRPVDVIRQAKVSPDKLVHPNEKPEAVIFPFLESHEGIVLDPFMGSGSTLAACKQINRPSVGIEINKKYCEIAKKRLKATCKPLFSSVSGAKRNTEENDGQKDMELFAG